MERFEHLHTHTHYSLLDGLSNIGPLCERALELGQSSVAITDHGSIAGVPELFRTCADYGLKPIAGMEAYFCEDINIKDKSSQTHHLTLLAKNADGYKSLCNLVTESYKYGFYGKPRIDCSLLEKYNKGLIILSGCMNGIIAQNIIGGKLQEATKWAYTFMSLVGKDNFYLEYMDHGIKEQKVINATQDMWFKKHGWKGVLTQDSHYLYEEDTHVHQTLLCIGSRSTISAPKFVFNGGPYHYCDKQELHGKFQSRLFNATVDIADSCDQYNIERSGAMPKLSSSLLGGKSPNQYLETIAWEGLKRRGLRKKIYEDRLRYELTTIYQLGYASYFIMVHDILKWARKKSILVGPGRGSSAGSLTAYCLQITDIDPIRYNLYFERFLNKDRVSPPDIDVDIADSGRQEVLQYVRETYGEDRVAHIGSFSAMGPRQSVRDVAIAHGLSFEHVNGVIKRIPHDPMLKFDTVKELSVIKELPAKVMQEAETMNGKYRHMTTHSAGIVIANHKLADYMPLVERNDVIQTMYDMNEIQKLGYTKFDILGLKTLGVISRTIKSAIIHDHELKQMYELNDPTVYALIASGHTMGVFQLEGWGCTQMVKRYQPKNFEDIMMINALYRPGPMQGGEGLEIILRRRNGEEDITFKHPDLQPILAGTYGLPVFQEQVMRMCQVLASFTMPEADSMRSAIGKKDEAKLASYRSKFLNGCRTRRMDNSLAEELWEDITFFNRYGWNRAHAAAYGAVTYYTAWLKTHYKEHFMAELINSEDDPERDKKLKSDCHGLGIEFERVDINKSDIAFRVHMPDKVLVPGFSSVKGVGEKAANAIVEERRKNGKYHGIDEVRSRIPRKVINNKVFDILVRAGAFRDLPEVAEKLEVPF